MVPIMHSGPGNKNVSQAIIAAEYAGVHIKKTQMGNTLELNINPMEKVCVLVSPEEDFVLDSNPLACYVALGIARGSSLLGSSAVECGEIEEWIAFSSTELDANLRGWVLPRLGFADYMKPIEDCYIANTKRVLTALNTHLATHTFLVGDSLTLADIITTCNLFYGIEMLMPKSFTSEYPHVERYFWTMVNEPNFKKVLHEVRQAEAVLPSAKKPEQPKEMKPKADAPNPKATPPLDFLHTSNFHERAIKGFWDMFDPKVYSLWFCIFNHDDKNTRSVTIMNKLSEFLPQMDRARRYGFCKMLISGNMPPFKMKGLWLFHDTKVPHFFIDECYDMKFYEWTQVDQSDEAQKKQVNKMIECMMPFEVETLFNVIA